MTLKRRSACSPEEALRYLDAYFAANDMLTSAIAKYERLTIEAPTSAERSLYRAESLHAERELELLRNKRRAFLDDQAVIDPPSPEAVKHATDLATKLAETAATQAKGEAIINIVAEGLDAFAKIQAA